MLNSDCFSPRNIFNMDNQNTVKYTVICNPDFSKTKLDEFCSECQTFCDALTKDYIWQKEPFILNPVHTSSHLCLCGSTDYGENLNDEWFIVYVLYQLSKHYRDIVIQVTDEDGEFLLIQAADVLPRWLKPEVSENRVFIKNGRLHIIPQPTNPGEMGVYPTSTPSIQQSYTLINSEVKTLADESIQAVIEKKLSGYPGKVKEDLHHAHCYIPTEVAYILHEHPNFVARAVQAFYERDPVDVNVCSKMKRFPPNDCLLAPVTFTKHLYGQLHQAKFVPNTKSKWRLPPPNDKLYKAAHLGYKLTCGFEILVARCTSSSDEGADAEPHGRKWNEYLENLKNNDFFRGELEGSKKYTELLKSAKEHFKEHFVLTLETEDMGDLILQLAAEANIHTDELKELYQNIGAEDDDNWLTLTPEQLDEMLLSEWKNESNAPEDESCGIPNEEFNINNLSKMASTVKSFVDQVSSYEGAEVSSECNGSRDDDEINFDPNTFMGCVKNLLGGGNGRNDHDDDSESEDGSDLDVDDDFVSCFKDGQIDNDLSQMMAMMDSELKSTNITKSFQNKTNKKEQVGENAAADVDAPLDLDYNVIENFLESFASQDGLPGPVSTLMRNFGLNLPPDEDR